MTAGRLAAASPAATTDTVLYTANANTTASTVVQVAERGGAAATYRIGHKDYTQELTLDAGTYDFEEGNILSNYIIEINPGLTEGTASPGLELTSEEGNFSAKIGDVYRVTGTTTYNVIISRTGGVGIDNNTLSGTFVGGETVTSNNSGLSGTFRGISNTALSIEMADMGAGVTTIPVSDGVQIAPNSYMVFDADGPNAEIVTVSSITFYNDPLNTGGADVVVTRGSLGTAAVAQVPGQYVSVYAPSLLTTTINEGSQYAAGDTTLTVTNGTVVLSGQYIVIDNEVLQVTDVSGNDLTVIRGQFGTTDAAHVDGATVSPMDFSTQTFAYWFASQETLSGATASIDLQITGAGDVIFSDDYIWAETPGEEVVPAAGTFSLDVDRTYRFLLEDATNTGLPLRFSDVLEGTGATPTAGTEFTTGVTKVGTAGVAGAYIEIDITSNTPDPLFYYAEGTTGYSASIDINPDPTFTQIYIYGIQGTPVTGNTFFVGTASQTVGTVSPGAYAYVRSWDPGTSKLKVFVAGSIAIAASDTFPDSPPVAGTTRAVATVSSVTDATDLADDDYIYHNYAIAANSSNTHSGIVVGPASHLVVYASTGDLTFQVNGFENNVGDFTYVDYRPALAAGAPGGGDGAPAPGPNP